jgi:two-component SAPR family response regulator
MVRTYGAVEVCGPDGAPVRFERSKSLELVVWLANHRRRPTRSGARAALWDTEVRDATFANVVSEARRSMSRLVPRPDGSEWIERSVGDDLPLHRSVVTDAEVLEARVSAARGLPPAEAVALLRPAMELVEGMPFAGTSWLWSDAEGISSSMVVLATGAAIELAQHYLVLGDMDGVFWATGRGLTVLNGHEECIALRMRAHAERGDLAGVRAEWERYERALAADPWSAGDPAPKLVQLRSQLLRPAARVAGGCS